MRRSHVIAGAVAVSALSLALMRTPDYDPTAWLIWGEQLARGELRTVEGPSWKPFPVLFTTPFALLGDTAAEWLWLVVARAGGLLGIGMAYVLACRLGGRAAGLIAAAGLALAPGYLYNAARGDAEGLLVLCGLGAIWMHLEDRRALAIAAGVATALIRPEAWPLLGLYLLRSKGPGPLERNRPARLSQRVLTGLAVGALVLAAWLVPEKVGSGDWLRAGTRATQAAPGTPGDSAVPFLAVLAQLAIVAPLPLLAGAVVAARRLPWLTAIAGFWTLEVAVMAELGFTGNLRYLTPTAALLCVIGGVGLASLRLAPVWRWAAVAAAAISLVPLAGRVGDLAREGRVYGRELPEVIERAGGVAAVRGCGPIGADHFAGMMVARRLELRMEDVLLGIDPAARTVLATEGTGAAQKRTLPVRFRHGDWLLRSAC